MASTGVRDGESFADGGTPRACWPAQMHLSSSPVSAVYISRAVAKLASLVDQAQLPVATTHIGRGAVDETHALTLGMAAKLTGEHGPLHFDLPLLPQADVVLLIGTRTNENGNDSRTLTVNPRSCLLGSAQHGQSAPAPKLAWARARRPKPARLESDRRLHDAVAAGWALSWSPRQICARLRADHPEDEAIPAAGRRLAHRRAATSCLAANAASKKPEPACSVKLTLH